MSVGVLYPWTTCYRALLPLYLYLLITPRTCCKAGSLSEDQSPPYADTQDPCQSFPFPDHVYFDETSAAGSIIFVSNETYSTKKKWSIANNILVALTFVNQTYQITLPTAVDLDVTNPSDTCISWLEQFTHILTCTRTGGIEPIIKEVTFHVLPVNEYQPDVNVVPVIVLSEGNVNLPFFLLRTLDYFKDRDCPREHLELSISKYSSSERDASRYFIVNSSTGYLYQVKHFDYENTDIQCYLGIEGGFLNITVEMVKFLFWMKSFTSEERKNDRLFTH